MAQFDLDAIRSTPIVEVISQRIPLQKRGQTYCTCCPFHTDRTPSLYVYPDTNRYWCFGCGAKGNPIDFVMEYDGVDFRGAAERVGGCQTPSGHLGSVSKVPKGRGNSGAAQKLWQNAGPIRGTIAERYLANRGLYPEEFPSEPPLRFARILHPETRRYHPAMLSSLTDLDGNLTGIQRTFLTDDGHKLAGAKAKLSLGAIRGNATKLGNGTNSLIICEGLEDGLSVWVKAPPDTAVWVAAGASNICGINLPLQTSTVTIASDNDPAGRSSAEAATKAYGQPGRTVKIVSPLPEFKDFNEMLQKGCLA